MHIHIYDYIYNPQCEKEKISKKSLKLSKQQRQKIRENQQIIVPALPLADDDVAGPIIDDKDKEDSIKNSLNTNGIHIPNFRGIISEKAASILQS